MSSTTSAARVVPAIVGADDGAATSVLEAVHRLLEEVVAVIGAGTWEKVGFADKPKDSNISSSGDGVGTGAFLSSATFGRTGPSVVIFIPPKFPKSGVGTTGGVAGVRAGGVAKPPGFDNESPRFAAGTANDILVTLPGGIDGMVGALRSTNEAFLVVVGEGLLNELWEVDIDCVTFEDRVTESDEDRRLWTFSLELVDSISRWPLSSSSSHPHSSSSDPLSLVELRKTTGKLAVQISSEPLPSRGGLHFLIFCSLCLGAHSNRMNPGQDFLSTCECCTSAYKKNEGTQK